MWLAYNKKMTERRAKNSDPTPDMTLPCNLAGAPAVGIGVGLVKVPDGVTVAGVVKLPVGVTVADGPVTGDEPDSVGPVVPVGSEVLPSPGVGDDDDDPAEPVEPVEPVELVESVAPVDSEAVPGVEVAGDDVVESGGIDCAVVDVAGC